MSWRRVTAFLFLLLWLSACTKQKPRQTTTGDGTGPTDTLQQSEIAKPLTIDVVYPENGQPRPNVDSNFIFGSVSDPAASLSINGNSVILHSAGGFLAFLPEPADGRFVLIAEAGDQRDTFVYQHKAGGTPASDTGSSGGTPPFGTQRIGQIVRGADTLQTGSDVAVAAPTPNGDRKWFLPKSAHVKVVDRSGKYLKVQFSAGTSGWIADSNVSFDTTPTYTGSAPTGEAGIATADRYTDIVLPARFQPFLITPSERGASITVYGASSSTASLPTDGFVQSAVLNTSSDGLVATVGLSKRLWGFKAFYRTDGALVVRLRQPPKIDPVEPLRGMRIVVDAGHPPVGATGPTRLTEADANLAIALRIAQQLRQAGAQAILTRSSREPIRSWTSQVDELGARASLAVNADAEILLSVHNNAFPDGVNPFFNYGTGTYYYHNNSGALARELVREIAYVTGIPNQGARSRSLAIVRPTWMPAALTESLYMMFPEQEALLRNDDFLTRLAAAHVRGLRSFLMLQTLGDRAGADRKVDYS